MITLSIDERTYRAVNGRATARGISVEEWLRIKAAEEAVAGDDPATIPHDEWMARMRAIGDRHIPTGVPVDDSRESIYD